jgi:5-methylthioadenosine/S-adenosylhomocysteine deaminase
VERTLIRDTWVVTQDDERRIVRGDVLIEGETIAGVGPGLGPADRVIDGRRRVVIPGMVNAHGHIAMHAMRGVADDMPLEAFLDRTFAIDAKRTSADIEAGARLGALELLRTGSTSCLDLYYDQDAVARGLTSLGIRSWLGWAVLDEKFTTQKGNPLANCQAWASRARELPRVTPMVAPQGVYVCSEETYHGARQLADRLDLPLHTHLSETRPEVYNHQKATGMRPVEWLSKVGFLSPRLSAAHLVWVTMRELDLLKQAGVTAVHCPTSNMKLASGGVCPVPEMLERGVNVALGTDGVSSNNSVNMFEEMKHAALLQKSARWDARLLTAQQALDMATRGGAAAVGALDRIGSIEVGKQADLVVIDRGKPSLAPLRLDNLISGLVYAGGTDIVDTVFVAGEVVLEGGQPTKVDAGQVVAQAEQASVDLMERAAKAGGAGG